MRNSLVVSSADAQLLAALGGRSVLATTLPGAGVATGLGRYSSVNFRGTFRFSIDRYRQSLIIDGAPRLKMVRSN